jgi:hypothetical protein
VVVTVIILAVMTVVICDSCDRPESDDHYYGIAWISSTYNIFQFNAAGGADELFGVKPVSYCLLSSLSWQT